MEIELYSKLQNPIEAIDRIGEFFAKSGMFGCDKIEQGKVLAMVCLAERKSPVSIARTYHIMEGKLSKKALAALAEFRAMGGKHQWKKTGDESVSNEDERHAEGYFKDRDGNELTYRYSIADAKREGIIRVGSRWTKRPGNMLRARVISNALGMLCPEIYAGDDESEDHVAHPAAEMNLKPAAVESVTGTTPQTGNVQSQKEKTPQTVIDVQAQVVTEEKKPETVKTVTASPTPPPATTMTAASGPKLSDELLAKVKEALAGVELDAIEWMTKQTPPWITPPQTFADLMPIRAEKIVKQIESFKRTIAKK
jgi:hypothetical protein